MLFQTVFLSTMLLAVSHCAPHGLERVEETYHLAGQERPAVLSCILYGGASADTIEWFFNGQKITIDSNKYKLISRTRLEVHNISGRDEGLYSCSYLSGGVRMSINLLCIYVLGAAEFANNQTMTIDALRGESAELDAHIVYSGAGPLNNNQTVTLLQLFKGTELVYFCGNEGPRKERSCPSTERISAIEASHKFDLALLLKNLSLNDSGSYLLRVEVLYPGVSSRSYLTKSFTITIHEPFDVFRVQQTNNSLECQVKLSNFMASDLKLDWTKPNGEHLTDSDNVKLVSSVIANQVTLTAEFNVLSPQLEGEYSCVASLSLPDSNVIIRTASTILKSDSSESSDGNDLQISIGPITDNVCGVWFDLDKSLKMELAIRRGLASILDTQCENCGISIADFSSIPGRLSCSNSRIWLNYKTTIVNIVNRDNIFQAIESLKQESSPTINIGLFTLHVNPTCTGKPPLNPSGLC